MAQWLQGCLLHLLNNVLYLFVGDRTTLVYRSYGFLGRPQTPPPEISFISLWGENNSLEECWHEYNTKTFSFLSSVGWLRGNERREMKWKLIEGHLGLN